MKLDMRAWRLGFFGALAFGAACSSGSATAPAIQPAGNGVDDVKGACVIRAGWQNARTDPCLRCLAFAPVPPCPCSPEPNAGACLSQSRAKEAEPDCTNPVTTCVDLCAPADCSCMDECFVGHDQCRAAAAALDGCVAAVCNAACQ